MSEERSISTDVQLAGEFGIELEKFHQLRRRYNWPCVKLGRFEFRFTEEQRQQILAQMTQTERPRKRGKAGKKATPVKGQTARSAARRRAS